MSPMYMAGTLAHRLEPFENLNAWDAEYSSGSMNLIFFLCAS